MPAWEVSVFADGSLQHCVEVEPVSHPLLPKPLVPSEGSYRRMNDGIDRFCGCHHVTNLFVRIPNAEDEERARAIALPILENHREDLISRGYVPSGDMLLDRYCRCHEEE